MNRFIVLFSVVGLIACGSTEIDSLSCSVKETKGPYIASFLHTPGAVVCGADVIGFHSWPLPCPDACLCFNDFVVKSNSCQERKVETYCLNAHGDQVSQLCKFNPTTLIGQCVFQDPETTCIYNVILAAIESTDMGSSDLKKEEIK